MNAAKGANQSGPSGTMISSSPSTRFSSIGLITMSYKVIKGFSFGDGGCEGMEGARVSFQPSRQESNLFVAHPWIGPRT